MPASLPHRDHTDDLEREILDALPQTQCGRCGYPDCAAYAHAIASGEALINRCPPGGNEGIRRLAAITHQAIQPLDPRCGIEKPRNVAWIDESWCIGCTLCAKACPVDCIVGSNKLMHTVIETQCTGCELCVAACPVDCIHMENVTGAKTGWDAWTAGDADTARQRYEAEAKRSRLENTSATSGCDATTNRGAEANRQIHQPSVGTPEQQPSDAKSAAIRAAFARARAKRVAADTHFRT